MGAVGRTLRLSVTDEMERLDETKGKIDELLRALRDDINQLPEAERNAALESIYSEIQTQLSPATLRRLNDYNRLRNTAALSNRIALAVAGWLLGPGSGEQNLLVATSLVKVRDLVSEYLRTASAGRRQAILEELRSIEGSQIDYVARLLPRMKPPKQWPEGSEDTEIPGLLSDR